MARVKNLPQYRFSSSLHYINFPHDDPPRTCAFDYTPPATEADVHDQSRIEVITAVANYTHRLLTGERGSWAESEALRFLVHFVEDVHQPLHREYTRLEQRSASKGPTADGRLSQ